MLLCQGDNKLLLDLHSRVTPALLRDRLVEGAQKSVILQEMLPAPDRVWLSDGAGGKYVGEFVVSLTPRAANTASVASRSAPILVSPRKSFGPGSQWLYAKLYLGDQAFEELLLRDVAPLIARWRESTLLDRWFFVRYADPEPHLRVRFRATGTHDTTLREDLLNQLEHLLAEGRLIRYAFDTYDPEYERYGGNGTMDAVERFFTIDSDVCLEQLRNPERSTDARVAMAAETFFSWLLETSELQDLALGSFSVVARGKLDKTDRDALKRLAAISAAAAPQYGLRDALAGHDPESRLRSIFHMHCNRLGVRGHGERRSAMLVRAMITARRALLRDLVPS